MRRMPILISTLAVLLSCKKNTMMMADTFSEASYMVTFSGKWSAPAFGVPAGVHFTALAGGVHNTDAALWTETAVTCNT